MSKILPDYFMVSECDGGLYDTRKPNWSATPIRSKYRYAHNRIETGLQLRSTLRVPFTFPGSYDILLFTSDGGTLCNKCATENVRSVLWSIRNRCDDGWRVVACDADCNFDEVTCDHCGKQFGVAAD